MSRPTPPPHRHILAVLVIVAAAAAAANAFAAPARAAPPDLPEPAAVPGLDDAKLYALYQALFPEVDVDIGVRGGDESNPELRQATYLQIERRAGRRLSDYLDADAAPDVEKLTDAELFLLLYGITETSRYTREAPPGWQGRVEAAARHAVRRAGHVRDFALARYPFTDVAWMGDAELRDLLPRLRGMNSGWDAGGRTRERVLCEIVRRAAEGGRADWQKVLSEERRSVRTLETITALRRVQGKPDPVRVEVDGPADVEAVFPSLPRLKVSLVNRDEKEFIPFTQGGDYRSGRQARWRIEVRDEAGKPLPGREQFWGMGGGLYHHGVLPPGHKWSTSLDAASWVAELPPGKYTLRVLYHDTVTIADQDDVGGLIVCSSEPLALTVKPLVLYEDEVDRRKVGDMLAAIDETKKLKVVGGTYGDWAHELVPPDSPQGRLLALGLPAVPPLLEALDDTDLKPARRAVVLSLLFSLTGQNDPRDEPGVLGGYDSADGPWAISNDGAVSFGFSGLQVLADAKIEEGAQRTFAGRWVPWKRYVRVVPRKA